MKFIFLACLFGALSSLVVAQSTPPRKDIPSIAKSAKGAIVTIVMVKGDKPIATGTGFLVSRDGMIVTNYHVIENGDMAMVKLPDDTILPVEGVLASDKRRDLAIIKIQGKTFRTLSLGNSDRVEVGEEVVAIGNPLGLELTVSNGILSAVRTVENEGGKFLQTTAPISHGSSGGPLFNMQGEVLGITSMFMEGGENLNFAIPINDVKHLLTNASTLQNLPDEPLKQETDISLGHRPEPTPVQSWLSSARFTTPEFSARFPSRVNEEPAVSCIRSTNDRITSTTCEQDSESGHVQVAVTYADLSHGTTASIDDSLNAALHCGALINPVQLSISSSTINQDQSFAEVKPIPAREIAAKGIYKDVPARICMRSGLQEHRVWMLMVMFPASSGHTQKECDEFFDSVTIQ